MSDRGIIFDLFGVVCEDLGHAWISRHSFDDKRELLEKEYFVPGDLGHMREEDYWSGIAAITGWPETAIRDEWYSKIAAVPGTLALVEDMRSVGRTMLCTNTSSWLFDEVDRRIGLSGRFDDIIKSCDAGIIKPNPAIYRLCLEQTGTAAAATLFIDDREKNIRGAEEVGMQGIVFSSAATLAQELAQKGFAKNAAS